MLSSTQLKNTYYPLCETSFVSNHLCWICYIMPRQSFGGLFSRGVSFIDTVSPKRHTRFILYTIGTTLSGPRPERIIILCWTCVTIHQRTKLLIVTAVLVYVLLLLFSPLRCLSIQAQYFLESNVLL